MTPSGSAGSTSPVSHSLGGSGSAGSTQCGLFFATPLPQPSASPFPLSLCVCMFQFVV